MMRAQLAVGVACLVVAGVATGAPPATAPPPPIDAVVYVSGYSPQIARYRFDAGSGRLTWLGTTPAPATRRYWQSSRSTASSTRRTRSSTGR